ncbi:TetR/AcrR family transcriptional regulator [Thalassotalea atypica]|uniref:TetR/AcrR family transcriptional regulator n=1 Tax=Thalassotalea atypica TaxID=2054316 RepID=UPI00257236D4|nr:TetR/AcrR family transcriptional regulator [Thalassotalea atypica]
MNEKKLTRSDMKRIAIVDAATLEFQLKGFKIASMDDIAKRAQVSKRTVYNHFSSKEQLFNAILTQMFILLDTFEPVPYSSETPLAEQLTLLANHEITLLKTDGFITTAKVLIAEGIHSPDLLNDAMIRFSKKESPLTSWFKAAATAGVFKTEHVDFIATQFMAVIKAFCFWPQVTQNVAFPDDKEVQRVTDAAVDMILKQYT